VRVTASICCGVIGVPADFFPLTSMLSSFGMRFCRASASMCQAKDILSSRSRFRRSVMPVRIVLISRSVSRQNSSYGCPASTHAETSDGQFMRPSPSEGG
jgi:hypothetical protein